MTIRWRDDALARGGWKLADVVALTAEPSDEENLVARFCANRPSPRATAQRSVVLYTHREVERIVRDNPQWFREQVS